MRWTGEERRLWLATVEAEEQDRLRSLTAGTDALAAEKALVPHRVNALLVSALQAQFTLMKVSRVFPGPMSTKCMDVQKASGHGATASLAHGLHRAWNTLGVAGPTLEALLRRVVLTVSEQTRTARARLFIGVQPSMSRGVDPEARTSLAAEGSG